MQRRLLLGGMVGGAMILCGRGVGAAGAARHLQWDMLAGGDPARPYRIFLRVPAGEPPPGGFPVFTMLDGESQFGLVEEALNAAEGEAPVGPGSMVPGLVVAVGYAGDSRREYDYTPPFEGGPAEEGGAEGFLDFLVNELRPRVAREFPVDTAQQSLFGHSYGGLFSLYAMFTRSGAWRRTVAASPSIWYGQGAVLKAEDQFAANPPPDANALELLVTVGELEQRAPTSLRGEDNAMARIALQVDRARALSERLAVLGNRGPRMQFHVFPGKNHGTVIPVALARGLRFAFRPE